MCCIEGWKGGFGQSRDCGRETKARPSASARVCVYTVSVCVGMGCTTVDPNAFVRPVEQGKKGGPRPIRLMQNVGLHHHYDNNKPSPHFHT